MDEEWRVSLAGCVRVADGKPVSADSVRDLLGSRVGENVPVTAGKAGVFLYTATGDAATTAAGTARAAFAEQGLAGEIRVERWDPSCRAWLPPGGAGDAELPSGREPGPGRRRLRTVGEVIAAIIDGIG